MPQVNFILCIHNHQPVGNFESVIESAYKQAYEPFIDLVARFPQIKFCIHFSGLLLEYISRTHPKFISRLQKMVDENRLEIIGGGFYEPIMTMLPDADKIGQIMAFSEYLKKVFGKAPRGIWLAERVWEQALVKPLARAGIEYTIIDDFHFRTAGFLPQELSGYFITEDQGETLALFPIPEKLRYAIPFKEPYETINYLNHFRQADHSPVICYADDGEKFGLWPKTFEHCYQNKWLERFLGTLDATRDWLNLTTFSEVLDQVKPVGKAYIPSGSYREMTEWVLSNQATLIYEDYKNRQPTSDFTLYPGGFWRNFFVKYPEINILYGKMSEISRAASAQKNTRKTAELLNHLYQGQGNDAYWHGVFGGFYLPHLRHALYNHLLACEDILASLAHSQSQEKPLIEISDFDFDGYPEIKYSNHILNCYFKPSRGAGLYEFDILAKYFNPLATIARRQESYHARILKSQAEHSVTTVATIHDLVISKTPGLENLLYYDNYPRQSLLDHFIAQETTLQDFAHCYYNEEGDFLTSEYQVSVPAPRTAIEFSRDGTLTQSGLSFPLRVFKKIAFVPHSPKSIHIDYEIINTGSKSVETTFAPEFNLSMLAGNAHDRFYFSGRKDNLGPLITEGEAVDEKLFGVKDYYQKIDIHFVLTKPTAIWYFPIQTVSQSEGGFELVYQSSVILPRWPIKLAPQEKWTVRISKIVEFL